LENAIIISLSCVEYLSIEDAYTYLFFIHAQKQLFLNFQLKHLYAITGQMHQFGSMLT